MSADFRFALTPFDLATSCSCLRDMHSNTSLLSVPCRASPVWALSARGWRNRGTGAHLHRRGCRWTVVRPFRACWCGLVGTLGTGWNAAHVEPPTHNGPVMLGAACVLPAVVLVVATIPNTTVRTKAIIFWSLTPLPTPFSERPEFANRPSLIKLLQKFVGAQKFVDCNEGVDDSGARHPRYMQPLDTM